MSEFLKIATLDENALAKIRQMEKTLGTQIMAYETGIKLASLSENEVQNMQGLESDLGVILLAYEND